MGASNAYQGGNQYIKPTDIETSVNTADLVELRDPTNTNQTKYAALASIFGSATDLDLGDNETLTFGDGSDIVISYDGSNFLFVPAATDGWLIGTDAANLDITLKGKLTVGKDDTGHDVKFFGATASSYWEWDESADQMNIVGTSQFTGAVTVGVDDAGHDMKLFGATAGSYCLWDESADSLIINAGTVDCGTSCEADAYTVGGVAGVDYGAADATSFTVVKGIITAIS